MATWFKRARCEIQMLESIVGVAHGAERRRSLGFWRRPSRGTPRSSQTTGFRICGKNSGVPGSKSYGSLGAGSAGSSTPRTQGRRTS
eukprot:5714222-Pyramimonas_sp.AAC.1